MNTSQAFQDMIADLLPSLSDQQAFFANFQKPLKKSISIMKNREKFTDASTHQFSNSPNFQLTTTPFGEFSDTKYIDREDTTIALGKTWQHLTGQFYIQEVAASLPANILKSELASQGVSKLAKQGITNSPNNKITNLPIRILDVCAAPGGKTAQLADFLLTHNIPGIIRGNDVDAKRLGTRGTNIQRCGLYNTVSTKIDGSKIGAMFPEFFDAVLVDAPCSGEGTGFKSDAAYKRRRQESINNIVGLQRSIIESTMQSLKPGGIMIYSTCTINPFENEMQIAKILEKYGDAIEILPIDVENKSSGVIISDKFGVINGKETYNLTLNTSNFLRARPHIHHTGGFFVCVMRKKTSTTLATSSKKSDFKKQSVKTPFAYNKQIENTIKKVLYESFGIELDLKKYAIIEGKHKFNLTDASVRELVSNSVRFQECGIPILKATGKSFSLEHEIALSLGHLATKNTIELNDDELQRYCLGEDVYLPADAIYQSMQEVNNYIILTHAGLGVGVGKVINGMIKNKFFKW